MQVDGGGDHLAGDHVDRVTGRGAPAVARGRLPGTTVLTERRLRTAVGAQAATAFGRFVRAGDGAGGVPLGGRGQALSRPGLVLRDVVGDLSGLLLGVLEDVVVRLGRVLGAV
jgi:hypothetical protein